MFWCNYCKSNVGFVIKIALQPVVRNTIYRGVSVFGLQDSAIQSLMQVTELAHIVDNLRNKKIQLVATYRQSKGRFNGKKSAFADCFFTNQA